jgi:hypothetical protein
METIEYNNSNLFIYDNNITNNPIFYNQYMVLSYFLCSFCLLCIAKIHIYYLTKIKLKRDEKEEKILKLSFIYFILCYSVFFYSLFIFCQSQILEVEVIKDDIFYGPMNKPEHEVEPLYEKNKKIKILIIIGILIISIIINENF